MDGANSSWIHRQFVAMHAFTMASEKSIVMLATISVVVLSITVLTMAMQQLTRPVVVCF